jgi:cysteine-S-conjugate beta-lyase
MADNFEAIIDRRSSDSAKWHKYGPDVLPLWIADMDFRSPEPVIQALRHRIEHGVFGYGIELPEFSHTITERLQRLYGWAVSPEALVMLPGVIAGFNLACRAVTSPGDGVLLHTPLYPPILRVPGNIGLSSDEMELHRRPDGQYEIDFDAVEKAITPRTRAFILCNPHNPIGRVYQRHELARLAEICLRHDLIICADEIHCEVLFQGHHHTPIASLAPEIAAHCVTLMAPSKTFNLPGLKCAFAIIPNAELREKFTAVRADLVPQSVNILGYVAALAAYRHGQSWLDGLLRYLEANRDVVCRQVREYLPGVSMGTPEGTYLAWLDCRQAGIPGNDPYTFFLEKAKVALNDGVAFGKGGQGFVRLNFGCPRALLIQALEHMQKALERL